MSEYYPNHHDQDNIYLLSLELSNWNKHMHDYRIKIDKSPKPSSTYSIILEIHRVRFIPVEMAYLDGSTLDSNGS